MKLKKLLVFADLHMAYKDCYEFDEMKTIVKEKNPDIVLIAGDVYENGVTFNPYKALSRLEKPVIFCLGNHEFAFQKHSDVIKKYTDDYDPEKYDVHCLDIIGKKETDSLNFIGNVLWYDGSFKDIISQTDVIDSHWLDYTIQEFDFKKENKKCVEQIEKNFNPEKKNILLTHTCPDIALNMFSQEKPSIFNYYSGCKLLERLSNENKICSLAFCGHTHRYAAGIFSGVTSINVGNDYFFQSKELKYSEAYV